MIEDVIQLLNSHGIKYIDKGNYVKCLCLNPSHNDKRIGSFSIKKDNGICNCFACGFKGNIFTLNKILGEDLDYKKNKNFEFTKTIKPSEKSKEIEFSTPKVYGNLKNPYDNNDVLDFLHSIGYSDDFIKNKEIKYANYVEMISENLLFDDESKPTQIRDRICIPIYRNGKLINYECRTFVGDEIKVKYVKGCAVNWLYNWENINKKETLIVVESIKNLGNIWNITHNVVSMFHCIPTDYQMSLLRECEDIILYIDNDEGGKKTIEKFNSDYEKPFRICKDDRTYTVFDKTKNKYILKGYDCADCTIEENIRNINNAKYNDEFEIKKDLFEIKW